MSYPFGKKPTKTSNITPLKKAWWAKLPAAMRTGDNSEWGYKDKRRAVMEVCEPRVMLSADAVLGVGASAAIIDSFQDYSSLVQAHIDDTTTDFDTYVPGILLTQRDTNGVDGINDADITAPHMRDLLAVEINQPFDALTTSAETALDALDTDNDTTVSWQEAFNGIIVNSISGFLSSFDSDNSLLDADITNDGADNIDGDADIDSDDVELWVLNGLTTAFSGSAFPGSTGIASIDQWFDVDLINLSTAGDATFNLSFTAAISFVDDYQIDLGLAADAEEIEMPQWQFNNTSTDVTAIDRDVTITGKVDAPLAVNYGSGAANFAATDKIVSSVKAGSTGTENLSGKIVNVGFLGTQATAGSEFKLSMTIETDIVDPSSPTRLGFADGDGDNNLAERLAFEANSSGGILAATLTPDAAFSLATPILFDLLYDYETGDSGPHAVTVNVSAAADAEAVRAALQSAINATALNGLLTVNLTGGLLSIEMVGSDATGLGFTDGTHKDDTGIAPFELIAANGFDFDSDGDNVEDQEVTFSEITFLLSLGGALPRIVTVAGGTYNTTQWKSAVQGALDAVGLGGVTADVDTSDFDNVIMKLSAASSLEIADTDTLALTMTAVNAITQSEISALDAATPDQLSRLFVSTTDTDNDLFEIKMNLAVRDGLDFTPSGSPQLKIDAVFDTYDGPFDLPNSDPLFKADFNGNMRFALPMDNTVFEQYLDFNVFGRPETIAMIQQLEGWATRLSDSIGLAGVDIPLVQSVLGQVLDFADMIHDTFLTDDNDTSDTGDDVGKLLTKIPKLDADNPSIIFFTAQELGRALNHLGILDTTGLPAGDYAAYEEADKNILYEIDLTHQIANLDLPVDFTLDLAPLGNIYSDSNISLVAEGGFHAFLGIRMGEAGSIDNTTLLTTLNNGSGVDIAEGPAITGAVAVERVYGRLISNAHFNVTIGSVTYAVDVDADNTETNLTTAELIDDIKTALTTSDIIAGGAGSHDLNAEIDVVQIGDRIALIAKPGVDGFSLAVNTLDSAYTQLGLQTGRASTVSVISGPVVNPAAGNNGVLTIIPFGSAAVMLTINNAGGNVSVTDLVNDINEKIVGTALENKIIATRYGDRIVFSAIDQTVYGFSVAADATADDFFGSFSTLNAWLTVTAANEPPEDSLARFGRLSSDATLTINGVAITVDSDDTDGTTADTDPNGSLQDLADDINAKIAASALGTTVIAEVTDAGTRLVIRANASSVTGLTVTTVSGNPANSEMGFAETQTAGKLGVTGNRAAPYYYGPTATTSFRVAITGGTADTGGTPKTVTIDYPAVADSGGPLDLLTNATVYDLASDIQRALNTAFGSAAENPLLVGVDAGRLLFTIKPGSAGLGATGFNFLANSATTEEGRAINQLKLYDPTALPIPGSVNLTANQWDLLLTDRDGTIYGVTLDGDLDIGAVIASINAAGTDAVASIGPLGNGLQISDSTGGGKLIVRTVNGSNAAIDLGLYLGGVSTADQTGAGTIPDTPGLIIGDTIGTLALIDRVFLRQVDGSTPILGATFSITSGDPDTGGGVHLEANFGFVGVTATGEGTLTGGVGVTLVNGATGRTSLRDLFSAVSEDRNDDGAIDIDDFKQVINPVNFTLTGQFDFDVTVNAGGGIEALIGDIDGGTDGIQVGTFSIAVNDPGDPFALPDPVLPDVEVTWTAGDLSDLEMFKNIGFDDVLNALKQLADFLDDYAAFGFLNEDIPLIGINFNELVDVADRFRQAVTEIEQNPAGSVQLLEQKIREEFGLPPGVLTLSLADGEDADALAGDMLKIQFNLGGGFSESLPVSFGIPNDAIDGAPIDINLEGQADLNATGNLTAMFTIGVDLNSALNLAAPVFLYTNASDTGIHGSLNASANDLTFNAALGPVGVTIADGFGEIALSVDFQSGDAVDTYVALGSAFSHFNQITFNGSANAVLPVYFPTQSSYIGDISLTAAFEADVSNGLDITTFDVDIPTDFTLDFSSFSIFDNLGLLIDATDLFLSGVQDALDGEIMGFELPLAGDKLGDAVQFIEDFRSGFIKDLRNLVENAPSLAAETVQGFLFDLLHTKFDILADTDGDLDIDIDDVIIEGLDTLATPAFSDDYLQWNVLLGKAISPVDINVPFDLGFPALGLEGDIALEVTLGWELGIGLGISIADGAYIDVRRQDYTTSDPDDVLPELQLTLDVNIGAGSNISGSLLFLQLDIEEAPEDLDGDSIADPTHFHAEFSVDLMKGEDDTAERLAFSDIGSLDFDLDLTTDAAVNLDLTLKFNEDLIGESPLSAVLPEVTAHFALLWEWSLNDAESGEIDLSAGLKYIAFEDVGLDLGKFLGETIGPLVAKIQEVTEPFQPIIDIVTAAIPVLSDLAGEPVTLVDIAAAFGEFNPDLIYAVADLISLVNSIPTSPGSLILPFGNFVLIDARGMGSDFNFAGTNASNFTDPNFSFGGIDGSAFSTAIGDMGTALGEVFPNLGDGVASFLGGTSGDSSTKDTAESLFGGNFNRTGQDGQEYGFAFPIFEDPAQIFGLLLGRQATIVTYDLPPFVMDFSWKQSFPIYGPLWGVVTASVGLKIDLAFGYDTQGVSDFFDGGFSNPLSLLSGLYISDTDNPAGGGVDVPELVFTGTIGVGAELNAGIASAGATVNITLEVDFDLYDPNHDDKVRIDELLNTFLYEVRTGDPALAPLAIFDISGDVSLQLKAFIEILFARFDFDITPQITLFEFSIPFEREPFLATERSDGSLLLNIGTNAAARMNGDIRDLDEHICVEYIGNNQAKVWSEAFGISKGAAQIYTVDPNKGIVAYGGEGNDVIVVHGDIALTAEGGSGDDIIILDGSTKSANLRGGVGNDTLVGSGGDDLIWGEQGDDIIHGRAGKDWLFGDSALVSYGATGSLRVTTSDEDGNDIVWGGGDDDVIFGGGGNDTLLGDSDAIPLLSFDPFVVCDVTIDLDAIADAGTAGDDFIFGDGGRIDANASSTDTTLVLNLSGATDADNQGRTKFAGIRLTDAAGGGSDNIYGQAGNDVIFSGSGDDQADGGTDNDIIYGESGYDTLSGGAGADEIQGGLSKDFIFGFGKGPGDAYNDGGATDADGNDLLFGDDGNDLIRGNLGDDTIFGGRGADVLFGDMGTDQIYGENEGDTIFGGAGNDYVEGGTGNDTIFGDDGLVIYFVGNVDDASDDRVIGDALAFGGTAELFDYYDGTVAAAGNDDDSDLTLDLMVTYVRSGSDGDDTVIGGEGDDIAFGGAGDDTLYGDLDPAKWLLDYASVTPPPVPAGVDTLIGDGGRIEWFGRRIDKIESFKGVDETEAGDDTISGNGGADRLLGGGGSDTMYGRMAANFADGPDAGKLDEDVGVDSGKEIGDDDIMIGDDGVIDFARGTTKLAKINSTIYDPLSSETYVDTMYGNWGRDIMLGGLGGDFIYGDTGLTFSEPRASDDIMLGDNGELIFADSTIEANFGRLELIRTTDITDTTGGADTIIGSDGDDVILGGVNDSGEDHLSGDAGSDVMLGDNGELNFALGSDTDLNTLDLIRSYRDGLGGTDVMSGAQSGDVMIGGTGGDQMYGDDSTASHGADDGEDIMLGDNADIFLIGTVGRLTVRVGEMTVGTAVDLITTTDDVESTGGADTMSGNAGNDIMLGGVNNGGQDMMYGDIVTTTASTIANDGDDIMLGDNGLLDFTYDTADTDRNTLDLIRSFEDGLGGVDFISGNKGLDVAIGGTDGDTIFGDDANASAAANDLGDLLLGDNADIFLVAKGGATGGDLKVVLDAAVKTIRTTDEEHPEYGGIDTISGNAGGDIIAGGVFGDTLYGDRATVTSTTNPLDGNDIILGDNGAFEWLSTGRLSDISGIDIQENNLALYNKYHSAVADTDLTTLDLITTEQPTSGGRDLIYGDNGRDTIFGGTDADRLHGDSGDVDALLSTNGNDLMFGDHGRLYPQYSALNNFNSRNFFAIDVGDTAGGEGDQMWGEEGDDSMLGQQGDDRMWGGSGSDDMTGGHNVSGGYDELSTPAIVADLNPALIEGVNDIMDGGSGDDSMAGDNAIIWRRGDDLSPRFRMLTESEIYTTTGDGVTPAITANIDGSGHSDPANAVGRDIELLDHADDTAAGLYGADVMAGGADSDVMFGQLGNDLMQGDGNIGVDDLDPLSITREIGVTDSGSNPDTDETLYFNIPEQDSDGDDYMEGNGGSDLMYGGLGQDDLIGGSSALFGLVLETMRPDGSDIIFGGAGSAARIARNDFVGSTDTDAGTAVGVGAVATADDPRISLADRHSRDADFIMGDNANVYRLVDNADNFRSYQYDLSYTDANGTFVDRGNIRIVPRAMEQLDYHLGGADYNGGSYVNGAAQLVDAVADNGAGDLIHGESGDDYIFGMTGSDVIFGESDDDDIIGGYGNDWISGGTGRDGILGDDGLIYTSRNSTVGEALYGVAGLADHDPSTKYSNGNVLNEVISTPGQLQYAVINVEGELKKTVDLVPFSYDPQWLAMDDEFPDNADNTPFADDIIFGGLGSDWLHGGSGDDAISGAEALEHAYIPLDFVDVDGIPTPQTILDLGYNAFDLTLPINPGDSVENPNPGDALAFNSIDLDGQHLNNRFRAGEFYLYDEYNPLRKILLNVDGTLNTDGTGVEFLLNFDETEGVYRPEGTVPKATGQQTDSYPPVNDDGGDAIFGDLGNDWLVGGTGRDNLYGGWGNDLLNADDNQGTHGNLNDQPDTHPTYEDRAYGGAGRDVLIGNTGGDRLIDWVGEYNSYLVPYAPFGQASVSRTLQPFLPEYLYALSFGDGADPTRYTDAISDTPPAPTSNNPNPSRNGEPHGELGLVLQKDFAWGDQTGAPSDPQAGNIPGGKRDVLRSAAFGGANAITEGFYAESGTWKVSGGQYQAAPAEAGGDAISLYYVDAYFPKYLEILASMSATKPQAGTNANAYLLFDLQTSEDFKFAGINVSTNKLEIGHVSGSNWIVDAQLSFPGQIKSATAYNAFLALNGSEVTLIINNQVTLSYTFAPRVDEFGNTYGVTNGMIGVGTHNAKAQFDNVVVQRLAPVVTISLTDDFENGVSDLLLPPLQGGWTVADGRYEGIPVGADIALSLMSPSVSAASLINLGGVLKVTGEGGFVFDEYSPSEFKFVTLSEGVLTLGHHTAEFGWAVDATYNSASIDVGVDYTLGVLLKDSKVDVTLNGILVISRAYNAVVTDGNFGLLSRIGTTSFNSVTFQSDDPALTPIPAASQTSTLVASSSPSIGGITGDELSGKQLQPVIQAAVTKWIRSGLLDGQQIRQLQQLNVVVGELDGLILAETDGNTITVDSNGAGWGWFVDQTPNQDREFDNFVAPMDSGAYGKIDLLSVLIHEIGHYLGYGHDDAATLAVMDDDLDPGQRLMLEQHQGIDHQPVLFFDEDSGQFVSDANKHNKHAEYEEDDEWLYDLS